MVLPEKLILTSESDTQALAQTLAKTISKGIVFLNGDLGAGKTTLVRYWLESRGHTGRVKSPTYTLVEPYQLQNQSIFHFDLYRLQDPEELDMMGFEEYLDVENLVLIEWSSKAGYLAPQADFIITISVKNDIREVTISCKA